MQQIRQPLSFDTLIPASVGIALVLMAWLIWQLNRETSWPPPPVYANAQPFKDPLDPIPKPAPPPAPVPAPEPGNLIVDPAPAPGPAKPAPAPPAPAPKPAVVDVLPTCKASDFKGLSAKGEFSPADCKMPPGGEYEGFVHKYHLSIDTPQTATLTADGSRDAYKFSPILLLYDQSGRTVGTLVALGDTRLIAQVTADLIPGEYTILVISAGESGGRYVLERNR
jgi:hypothetical protein